MELDLNLNHLFGIIAFIGSIVVAILAYLIKSFFETMRQDIRLLAKAVHELRGGFSPLRKDIKENTVALASARAELKAVWRYIDADKRSSDAKYPNKNGSGYPD